MYSVFTWLQKQISSCRNKGQPVIRVVGLISADRQVFVALHLPAHKMALPHLLWICERFCCQCEIFQRPPSLEPSKVWEVAAPPVGVPEWGHVEQSTKLNPGCHCSMAQLICLEIKICLLDLGFLSPYYLKESWCPYGLLTLYPQKLLRWVWTFCS